MIRAWSWSPIILLSFSHHALSILLSRSYHSSINELSWFSHPSFIILPSSSYDYLIMSNIPPPHHGLLSLFSTIIFFLLLSSSLRYTSSFWNLKIQNLTSSIPQLLHSNALHNSKLIANTKSVQKKLETI